MDRRDVSRGASDGVLGGDSLESMVSAGANCGEVRRGCSSEGNSVNTGRRSEGDVKHVGFIYFEEDKEATRGDGLLVHHIQLIVTGESSLSETCFQVFS